MANYIWDREDYPWGVDRNLDGLKIRYDQLLHNEMTDQNIGLRPLSGTQTSADVIELMKEAVERSGEPSMISIDMWEPPEARPTHPLPNMDHISDPVRIANNLAEFSPDDENWRQEKQKPLNRAQRILESAKWMAEDERNQSQLVINNAIDNYDKFNPRVIESQNKPDSYYEKPIVQLPYKPNHLGLTKYGPGLSEKEKDDNLKQSCDSFSSNGCGPSGMDWIAPEKWGGDNTNACNIHDNLYGIPDMPKDKADDIFNKGLLLALRNNKFYNGGELPKEHRYAFAVCRFGQSAYDNAQSLGKQCWDKGLHPLQRK